MTKPLISYYGGKQNIVKHIINFLPPHTCYVEVFAGGATLLFAKPLAGTEVINDINDLLITMYRVAIERPDELKTKIEATLYSQSEYRKSIKVIANFNEYDELEIAHAVFVSYSMSFLHHGGTAGWAFGRICKHNSSITFANRIKQLSEILARLRKVYVANEDALLCIKRWDSPETLFYCDPPYINTDQGNYSGYTEKNYIELCETLSSIKGMYILSNYQQPIEPKYFHKIEIPTRCSAKTIEKGKSRGNESLRTEILYLGGNKKSAKNWKMSKQLALFE